MTPKRSYFNGLAARWDGFPSPDDAPEKIARFVSRALPENARRILDAGCGTGILLGPLLAERACVPQIVEVDIAEEMLMEGLRKTGRRANVGYVCADALHLPFRGAAFDAALCFNALPHMAPVPAALRGMLGCLRPGGILAVGHLMGSRNLNAFHSGVGGAVGEDRLPRAENLGEMLREMGAELLCCEEAEDWYFVRARGRIG